MLAGGSVFSPARASSNARAKASRSARGVSGGRIERFGSKPASLPGWRETVPAPRIDLAGMTAGHFGVDLAAWKSVCYFAQSFYSLIAPAPPRPDRTDRQVGAIYEWSEAARLRPRRG